MKSYLSFVQQQWPTLSFGFMAVFWGNFGQTFFVGLFSAPIQQTLELSSSVYGSAYSFATLASAVTVIWAGSLIDRFSLVRYTTVVCIGLSLAAAVVSQSNSFMGLLLGFFLLRLFGQALLPHTGTTTLARTFDAHRGKALSISSSGFPVGEIMLPLLAVFLIGLIGWRGTYISVSVFVLLVVLPLMLFLIHRAGLGADETHTTKKHQQKKSAKVRSALLSDYRYWLALPGLMAGPFIATGIFIHQDFVISSKQWTPAWFASCFIVFGAVHWLSSLVSGVLVDRFQAVRLLPFFLLPMALSLLLLTFFSGPWVALMFLTFLAMSIGGSPPITGSLWPEMYGVDNLGTVRSLNIAIMVFATALSPALYGFCIDFDISFQWIFGLSGIYVVFSSALFLLSYTGNPQPHKIAASG